MTDTPRLVSPEKRGDDTDASIRPLSLLDFTGQEAARKNLKIFIEAAKANPGKIKQSGGSPLARDALVRTVLQAKTGARWAFISFPSGGERISALLGGHVDAMVIEPAEAGELIRSGKIRAVAQVTDARLPDFKDIPTLKEAGFDVPNPPQPRGRQGKGLSASKRWI